MWKPGCSSGFFLFSFVPGDLKKAEIIIVGGGLAGLTAAIHLSKNGRNVILFEKETFPHHKVCGEYVSKEILPYLRSLEVPLQDLNPVEISRLLYSTEQGNPVEVPLPLGGIGLSRYAFDDFLYRQAIKNGVEIKQETVTSVKYTGGETEVVTPQGQYRTRIVLGAFGKRSNLDKDLKRDFFKEKAPWLAVKAHYEHPDFPEDLVALHNFNGGYCGLSKTETGAINVCYLATYNSFKEYKAPEKYNEHVLRKNPFLNSFFSEATALFDKPLSIAQISFHPKDKEKDHIMMLGDAAGLLHPLCGNGMAMAIHSAKIASETVIKHLQSPAFDRSKMEQEYKAKWNIHFRNRLRTGRLLQKILLNQNLAELSQSLVSKMPFLLPEIIKRTHGKPLT